MSSALRLPAAELGYAINVDCDGDATTVTSSSGRVIRDDVAAYPFLVAATFRQRRNVEVTDSGTALRWPELDETLGVDVILSVDEETIARLAGFTIYASRPDPSG